VSTIAHFNKVKSGFPHPAAALCRGELIGN
jgi:hypothetical protein